MNWKEGFKRFTIVISAFMAVVVLFYSHAVLSPLCTIANQNAYKESLPQLIDSQTGEGYVIDPQSGERDYLMPPSEIWKEFKSKLWECGIIFLICVGMPWLAFGSSLFVARGFRKDYRPDPIC